MSRGARKPVFGNYDHSDTNRAVKSQKMARGSKSGFRKKRNCTIHAAKKKALISFAVTAKLVCAFVFAYANFSLCGSYVNLNAILVIISA